MPPRRLPAPARPTLPPSRPEDQLLAVAAILAAGLARLRVNPLISSDFETNELATAPHKSVTVPDA